MKAFLEWLGVCLHHWKILTVCSIVDEFENPIGKHFYLQCSKCGDIKSKKEC